MVRLGLPLVDDYLEFLQGRCRPNTVLAAAYDLKVFFGVVDKAPAEIVPADVLGFITAQRTGRRDTAVVQPVAAAEESAGVAVSTVARRLSIVSGFFAYLQARGDITGEPGAAGAADPAGTVASGARRPTDPADPAAAADPHPGRGRCADRGAAHPPGPGDGRGDGVRWAATL